MRVWGSEAGKKVGGRGYSVQLLRIILVGTEGGRGGVREREENRRSPFAKRVGIANSADSFLSTQRNGGASLVNK